MARRGDGLYQRGRSWYLDCRINSTRHVLRLGKNISKTVAGELASVKRAAILRGEAGIGKKRRDITYERAKEAFVNWAKASKRPRTVGTYTQCLDHLAKSFAGKNLSAISSWLVERHKQDRVKAGAKVRANREIAVLKMLFNRCVEWGFFEGTNPATSVKFIKEPKRKLRYLEPEEEERLLEAAREPLRSIILIGIHTGLRLRSEALTLRWEYVDLRRKQLTVEASYAKSGETRMVNLNSVALSTLQKLKSQARGSYVFAKQDGTPYQSIRRPFKTACEKSSLHDITPHTLRHTFASRLAMAGVDMRTIQELGGWRELKMVERYSHLSPNHKQESVEKLVQNHFTTDFTTAPVVSLAKSS